MIIEGWEEAKKAKGPSDEWRAAKRKLMNAIYSPSVLSRTMELEME